MRRFPLGTLFLTNMKEVFSKRRAFFWEALLMAGNNLIFFVQWFFFFDHFGSIRGWHLSELSLILAITLGSWGIISLFLGGLRDMSQKILLRELDPLLLHPLPLLPQLLLSRSFPRGAGHLLSSLLLAGYFGHIDSVLALVCLMIALCCATIVLLSAAIMAHAIAFFLPISERLPIVYTELVLLFGGYPVHILPVVWQLILFTLIPAGFLAFFPVALIRSLDPFYLFLLLGGALISYLLAHSFFYLGLKRYCHR